MTPLCDQNTELICGGRYGGKRQHVHTRTHAHKHTHIGRCVRLQLVNPNTGLAEQRSISLGFKVQVGGQIDQTHKYVQHQKNYNNQPTYSGECVCVCVLNKDSGGGFAEFII